MDVEVEMQWWRTVLQGGCRKITTDDYEVIARKE